ncbi:MULTISPECIES: DUF397 domain-containing protein [unclassified Streptomyces]|uniref:DUF397 domain-containing protein n=1 Tax=unclassified Streptomyces TaxID=2593676 RepID=UPI00366182B7
MSTTRPTPTDLDHAGARWHKSTFSGAQNDCVEIGATHAWAGIRDTKQRSDGPVIIVSADALSALVTAVSTGTL